MSKAPRHLLLASLGTLPFGAGNLGRRGRRPPGANTPPPPTKPFKATAVLVGKP